MASGGTQNLGSAEFTITAMSDQFKATLAQLDKDIERFGSKTTTTMNATSTASQSSIRGIAMGAQQLGYAIDDLQYGFQGVINNIQPLGMSVAQAFGASTTAAMALSGAVGIIAVGINTVSQHWGEWFSTADKLPDLTQDVDQLGRALAEINPQLDELIKRKEEAAKPIDMGNLWGLTKERFNAFDQEELDKLKATQAEAKKRIREEKDLESTGPEHTKESQDVGKRVRDAIAEMPEGSDTLMGMLAARGMGREKAREAVTQAARGHSGFLNDIVGMLTPEEKRRGMFAGLANATPQAIKRDEEIKKAIKEGDEQARFTEKQFEDEKRKAKHDQERPRGQRQAMEDNHTARKRAFEDRGDVLQDREHAVRKEMRNKPFKGSYFDYATSHGDASIEKKQVEKFEAIRLEMRQLDTEKKAEQRAFEDRMKTFARQILGMGD